MTIKLPDAVQEKFDQWSTGKVLQSWVDDSGDVYYFVTRFPDGLVNCFRIFRIGGNAITTGRWEVSMDYQD